MSPDTLRTWARRIEVDQGRTPGVTTDVVEENRRSRRQVAELHKANEVLRAASIILAKELDRPTTR